MIEETIEIKAGGSNGRISPKTVSSVYEFYLNGELKEASEYVEWFDSMRHAGENDIIKIFINSYGGDIYSAIQFMSVLQDTNATVVCSVEGMCMSAATLVFLSADMFEVTPHSMFMFHNYSGGTIGKGGEMIDQIRHERKWSERLLREVYKDFLSEIEITSILDNRDIWMDGEEVINRIKLKIEKMNLESDKVIAAEIKATPKTKPKKQETI